VPIERRPAPAFRLYLLGELVFLYALVPTLFAWWRATGSDFQSWLIDIGAPESLAHAVRPQRIMFPLLFFFVILCLVVLLLDKSFDKRRLWRPGAIPSTLKRAIPIWLAGATALTAVTYAVRPDQLFGFPRNAPGVWLLIMLLYPILSVYPQGIPFRVFLFHRYRSILTTPLARIIVGALAFGWMHIVFLNPFAPALTLLGGLLFCYTYEKTRSALAASVDHALYGCWVFTVGLGWFFYGGSYGGVVG